MGSHSIHPKLAARYTVGEFYRIEVAVLTKDYVNKSFDNPNKRFNSFYLNKHWKYYKTKNSLKEQKQC